MDSKDKAFRVLRLIGLLKDPIPRTVRQLSKLLECNERTTYRYRNALSDLGYEIETDEQNRWVLPDLKQRNVSDLTTEEFALLQATLSVIPGTNPLKQSIYRKLFKQSELVPLADELVEVRRAKILSLLQTAISRNRVVKLVNYFSANSNTISDRIVEPNEFDKDFQQLTAWEPAADGFRIFKTTRIEQVEFLPDNRTYEGSAPPCDIFGMSGEPFIVKLLLNIRAYSLLVEEFSAAKPYIQPSGNTAYPYRLVVEVRSQDGVGRFILSLPGEIQVLEPPHLAAYLRERAGKGMWMK